MAKTIDKQFEDFFKRNQDILIAVIVSLIASSILAATNLIFIKPLGVKIAYNLLNILTAVTLVAPPTVVQYARYKRKRTIEEKFPDFLRDVVEGLRGGMNLPRSIEYASRNNYSDLSPYVKTLASQLTWGVPFEKALNNFAKTFHSLPINRAISTIIEAHRSGGNLSEVLEAVSNSTMEIDKIRKERESRISSQMIQGYVIYFIFLGVMIGMQHFLIPALASTNIDVISGEQNAAAVELDQATTDRIFTHLAIIQGFFAGLSIGKLAEGTVSAGFKHAVILALIGFSAMTIV